MFLKLITLSVLFFNVSQASVIRLDEIQNPATTLPGFDESINQSPAFYIWQNDPGLSKYYVKTFPDGSGVTNLCIPSAISDMLLYQFTKKTQSASNLILPGISADHKNIDGSLLVEGLLSKCSIVDTNNIDAFMATACLKKFYDEAGYTNSKVKLIRNMGENSNTGTVEYSNRAPTIADIHQAMKDGYEVSAAIAFMKWDPILKKWTKTGSHAVNVFGYSSNNADSDEKIVLYVSNPTRAYTMDFKEPIFDIASLEVNHSLEAMPEPYSNIEIKTIKGRLLNFEGKSTFLAGLILTKPN